MSSPVGLRWRNVGALAGCAVLGWIAFAVTPRVPVLVVVDLGFAQLGHLVATTAGAPFGDVDLLVAAAGPLAQVAVPLALAARLLSGHGDRPAGALCLAWGAASLVAVGADVADAASGVTGGSGAHDWSVLLGPGGLVPLDRAADLTALLDVVAALVLAGAVLVCLAPLVAEAFGAPPVPAEPPRRWAGDRRV
jgi:hypothetical protein